MAVSTSGKRMVTLGVVALFIGSLGGCSVAEELQNLVGGDKDTHEPAKDLDEGGNLPSSEDEATSLSREEQTEAPTAIATEASTPNETESDLEDDVFWDCLDLGEGMQWMVEEFDAVMDLAEDDSWSLDSDDGELEAALDALEVSVESFGQKVDSLNSSDLVPVAKDVHQAWDDLENVLRRAPRGEASEPEAVRAAMAGEDALGALAEECLAYLDDVDDL